LRRGTPSGRHRRLGGEIAEVVVDINQVDVVGVARPAHQIGHRFDDFADVGYQCVSVGMLISVFIGQAPLLRQFVATVPGPTRGEGTGRIVGKTGSASAGGAPSPSAVWH
jgi:hypothetical protein